MIIFILVGNIVCLCLSVIRYALTLLKIRLSEIRSSEMFLLEKSRGTSILGGLDQKGLRYSYSLVKCSFDSDIMFSYFSKRPTKFNCV